MQSILRSLIATGRHLALASAVLWLPVATVQAASTDIASAPLLVSTPNAVKANLLFILDDSGSMDFDFMPDHTAGDFCRTTGAALETGIYYSGRFTGRCCVGGSTSSACWSGAAPFGTKRGHPPFLASDFNSMAYNPAVRYLPPVDSAGIELKSMTSANTTAWASVPIDAYKIQNSNSINLLTQYPDTAWCTDNTYTDCLRNGNYVLPGTVDGKAYTTYRATTASGKELVAIGNPDKATTEERDLGPHYYRIVSNEYCTADNLRDCRIGASASHPVPATVRWCNSDANARAITPPVASCQAVRTGTFAYARYPTKYFTEGTPDTPATPATPAQTPTFAVGTNGCTNTRKVAVGPLMVNGVDLFDGAVTSLERYGSNLAAEIRNLINAKTGTTGFSATGTNQNIVIRAPVSAGNLTATATLSRAAGSNAACTFTPTTTPAFAGYKPGTPAVDGKDADWAGSFDRVDIVPSRTQYPRAATRTDCADQAFCSYDEEMTNFANWWAYYHSRMQSMKSASSRAFAAVTENRRLGYLSINNATGSDFLNLDVFEDTHKSNWFSKLFKAKPSGSTPLRTALARAGRLFGGQLNDVSVNGSTAKDPMQYSCQKNFTILSTDGYWNETSNPVRLDGTTAIGEQDGTLARPMLDGNKIANALSDTAAYYYNTDLRNGEDSFAVCTSGSSGEDVCGDSNNPNVPAERQVMRTFTLGLGASGYMQFRSNYLADTSGDFYAVKEGLVPNAATGVCSWQASGTCTWPSPVNNTLTTIDDLWHAAVNGGGTYFSAGKPDELFTGLATALAAIDVQTKAAAAATTSNPNVSAGDNQVFVSNFSSGEWTGDLISQRINTETGVVDATKSDWSARDLLDGNTARKIYLFSSTEPSKLKPFTWASLSATEQGYFSKTHITTAGRELSQFCGFGVYCLSAADQDKAAGEKLVSYLAGERIDEGPLAEPDKYFRQRKHLLGDIVNSEAVFVSGASFSYTDAGYAAHKAAVSGRTGMVYVAANDGMLHAFNASTGAEVWAFIPSATLPNLYRLADKEYATKHQYFVDATPTVQDVYIGGQWRTLLVGGLGAGGRSYYALDVTDPAAPKALWEFTDVNLGLTFGKPEIGKLSDGTWAVFFGSGYNNVSPGDGVGRLYVVNANDGSLIRAISTGAGSGGTPSGLTHIRGWVDDGDSDNTVKRVYAGDNLGNVWRFDVNNNVGAAGHDAQLLATLKAPDGATAQPVTSRPELGQVGTHAMVYVGTGRYLGMSDLTDTTTQSIYAIKDRLTDENFGDPRLAANSFVKQTLSLGNCPPNTDVCTAGATVRTNANPQPVNLASDGGWYVDLPISSERVNTDPQLALGTLVVNSNVIESGNVCKVGGSSWANFLDYATGAPVSTANGVTGVPLGNAIATRPALVKLPNNKVISISRLSDNTTVSTPTPISTTVTPTRRLSWRDLVQN